MLPQYVSCNPSLLHACALIPNVWICERAQSCETRDSIDSACAIIHAYPHVLRLKASSIVRPVCTASYHIFEQICCHRTRRLVLRAKRSKHVKAFTGKFTLIWDRIAPQDRDLFRRLRLLNDTFSPTMQDSKRKPSHKPFHTEDSQRHALKLDASIDLREQTHVAVVDLPCAIVHPHQMCSIQNTGSTARFHSVISLRNASALRIWICE